MSQTTILAAVRSLADFQFLDAALSNAEDLHLLPQARSLTEAFSAAEEHLPNIVLIDRPLTVRTEFEMMRALFDMHDVRWTVWDHSTRPTDRLPSVPCDKVGADLFVIDAGIPARKIVGQLRSIGRARRNGLSQDQPRRPSTRLTGQKKILIGASTGGVDALINVLGHFGAECPPTIIVQHTGRSFGGSLVRLLSVRTKAQVVLSEDGQTTAQGQIHVTAGLPGHIVLTGPGHRQLSIRQTEPVNGHIPSVDQLFLSAVPCARDVVAAVLTGMGKDGADGLLALRQAGARTIAQDEESSVVYGMPRIAWENGGAEERLSISDIGPRLLALAGGKR